MLLQRRDHRAGGGDRAAPLRQKHQPKCSREGDSKHFRASATRTVVDDGCRSRIGVCIGESIRKRSIKLALARKISGDELTTASSATRQFPLKALHIYLKDIDLLGRKRG